MDISTALGQPTVVTVQGRDVEVKCVLMGKLKEFALACAPFIEAFNSPEKLEPFKLLCEYPDEMMRAIACTSNVDVEFLKKLPPDDCLALATAVISMNTDFFMRRLAPALIRAVESVGRTQTGPQGSTN